MYIFFFYSECIITQSIESQSTQEESAADEEKPPQQSPLNNSQSLGDNTRNEMGDLDAAVLVTPSLTSKNDRI